MYPVLSPKNGRENIDFEKISLDVIFTYVWNIPGPQFISNKLIMRRNYSEFT